MTHALLAFALLGTAAQPETFLARHPELRVLEIEDSVLPEDRLFYNQQGYFRPTVAVDLTGDREKDLVVVVVQEDGQTTLFGVVVFLGGDAGYQNEPLWAIPLDKYPLQGVHMEGGNRLIPQYCTECDSNPFMRWNGVAFERNLFEVGEETCVTDYRRPVVVYERPDGAAPVVGQLRSDTPVEILEVGSQDAAGVRWFRAKVGPSPDAPIDGWLPGDQLCDVCCIG